MRGTRSGGVGMGSGLGGSGISGGPGFFSGGCSMPVPHHGETGVPDLIARLRTHRSEIGKHKVGLPQLPGRMRRGESHDAASSRAPRSDARRGVLENQTGARIHAQSLGSQSITIGRRLSVDDVVRRDHQSRNGYGGGGEAFYCKRSTA